jgi:hypothetical protein
MSHGNTLLVNATTRSEYTNEYLEPNFQWVWTWLASGGAGSSRPDDHLPAATPARRRTRGFDGFPKLKIGIGQMGEGLPFSYEPITDDIGEPTEYPLERPLEQYFQGNFWFTTGAFL